MGSLVSFRGTRRTRSSQNSNLRRRCRLVISLRDAGRRASAVDAAPSPAAQAPRSKIVKKDGAVPSAIETRVATELETIAANNAALKADLKNLYISSAREIEVDGGRKAIVVVVPFPLLADFKKIQKLLVEELEKKLGVGA